MNDEELDQMIAVFRNQPPKDERGFWRDYMGAGFEKRKQLQDSHTFRRAIANEIRQGSDPHPGELSYYHANPTHKLKFWKVKRDIILQIIADLENPNKPT
jgi:hypothetical protein